ncbi:unnamed protein product, partial [Mesorhabditis belari]|uniref:Plethodontid modulating factor n=1 Tax=Mesorhabditis belari TaxID=2138241 RepID=A0AAF3FJH3_9BILA
MKRIVSLILTFTIASEVLSIQCWYDRNNAESLSDEAEQVDCACGDHCLFTGDNLTPRSIRICGCVITESGEEHLCQHDEQSIHEDGYFKCCQGDLCNTNL